MQNLMPTLESVEKMVEQLTTEELVQFRKWFAEYDSDQWDEQIEADAAAGKLDALEKEALEDYYAGRSTEI
mgnify:CR=1 FL=1